MPFFIIQVNDIEICNLEGIGVGRKSFDLAIVFKDFSHEVHRIQAIENKYLDTVKDWLNSMQVTFVSPLKFLLFQRLVFTFQLWLTLSTLLASFFFFQIKYYESKLNMAWKNILKSILADPAGFQENGGWEFLNMEGSDDEEEDDDDDDEYAAEDEDAEEDEV